MGACEQHINIEYSIQNPGDNFDDASEGWSSYEPLLAYCSSLVFRQ